MQFLIDPWRTDRSNSYMRETAATDVATKDLNPNDRC